MADVMAIVSKAVFEQVLKGKPGAGVGAVLGMDAYLSTHKALGVVADGGSIFLVTVRPPDEKLWLVGILERPTLKADGWHAKKSGAPIRDITGLKSKLKFANGAGIQAKPGALGMSLQTPRTLTTEDAALLRGDGAEPSKAASKAPAPRPAPAPPAKKKASRSTDGPSTAPAPAPPAAPAPKKKASKSMDGAEALLEALAWWKETRAPKVADLVDAISERCSGEPITDAAAWSKLAMKKDPLDLGRLLPAIPSLAASFLPSAGELLAAFPEDPRIAKAVATWALEPPTTSSSTYPFWTRVLDAVGRTKDARAIPLFEKRLAMKKGDSQFWPKFYAALEKTVAKLDAPKAKLDADRLADLKARVSTLEPIGEAPVASAPPKDAPKVEGPLLVQGRVHLEAGRAGAAIEALLEHWRASRLPVVADLIDRLTRMLPTWDRPLGETPAAVAEAWSRAFAEDPSAAMPQLLQNINVGGAALAEKRLLELETLPDDPRIALRLAEICSYYGISPERTQYWKSLLGLLARYRDVRTCEPLRACFDDFRGNYYNHHRQARRIVGPFVQDPATGFPDQWPLEIAREEKADLAQLEKLAERLETKHAAEERALLGEIAAAWDDDSARLIYADWLSERGHPRGELIVLACAKDRTKAQDKRLAELEKTPYIHGVLQDLGARVDVHGGIARGFEETYAAGALSWHVVAEAPLISVIDEIAIDSVVDSAEAVARVLLDPRNRFRRVVFDKADAAAKVEPLLRAKFRAGKKKDFVRV